MQQLPNNCRIGKMTISPSNWKSKSANLSILWAISYRFYDDNLKQSKQVKIMGMNRLKTLKERQQQTENLIQDELENLQNGVNPFHVSVLIEREEEITAASGLIKALNFGFNRLTITNDYKINVRSSFKYFSIAAENLGFAHMPLKDITRRQIIMALDEAGDLENENKKKWTANRWNDARAHISNIYEALVEIDILDSNPVQAIKKKKQTETIRETTTHEQRMKIHMYLRSSYYTFWRYMLIFFHSGCRSSELLRLKKENVQLSEYRFKILVKKGRNYSEQWRIINHQVLHLWQELLKDAKPHDFIFSKNLCPGEKAISSRQITRRWLRHIKNNKDLQISADFYSLKHTHLDQLDEIYSIDIAQRVAGHTNSKTTEKYTIGRKKRKNEFIANANVNFA